MERWREVAIELFPASENLYGNEEETVWSVLFDAHDAVVEAHRNEDNDQLRRIYEFAAWCHSQKTVEPELWTAAYAAFYEHLVEDEETYRAIRYWVKPEIFRDVLPEFKDRLDNQTKYPGPRPGTFGELLELYDQANSTRFGQESYD